MRTCLGSVAPWALAALVASVSLWSQPARSQQAGEGIVIEGQLGQLTQGQLNSVLMPAQNRLMQCYLERLQDAPYITGSVTFRIRIGADGAVRWVLPAANSLGDETAQRCMTERLRALRFPPPRGGETETRLPLEFRGGDDFRPADPWPAARVSQALTANRAALRACRRGVTAPLEVVLYVGPRGAVATAGASIPEPAVEQAAACVLRNIATWRLPDPGAYYTRVALRLDQ